MRAGAAFAARAATASASASFRGDAAPAASRLLDDVRELVREHRVAVVRPGVDTRGEVHVAPVREAVDPRGLRGGAARVDRRVREIEAGDGADPLLHAGRAALQRACHRGIAGGLAQPEHRLDGRGGAGRRRAGRRGRGCWCGGLLGVLVLRRHRDRPYSRAPAAARAGRQSVRADRRGRDQTPAGSRSRAGRPWSRRRPPRPSRPPCAPRTARRRRRRRARRRSRRA